MRLLDGKALERVQEILRREVALKSTDEVARNLGMDDQELRRLLDGRRETMQYKVAERIVLRLRGPEEWHTDPALASYYV